MDELIYKFLLQSGYTRASIVSDIASIDKQTEPSDLSFVIVDPETTDRLAAILVVGPLDGDGLSGQSGHLAATAAKLGGAQIQGFIIRVDPGAQKDTEQVQFYRCYPNSSLQQLSAQTFPDLDSLKVHFKLHHSKPSVRPEIIEFDESDEEQAKSGIPKTVLFGGLMLLLLALIDWVFLRFFAIELLTVTQALLLISSALLLSWPALLRFSKSM